MNPRAPAPWRSDFLEGSPMFAPLAGRLRRLDLTRWPAVADLQALVDDAVVSGAGVPLHFVAAGQESAPDLCYERRILQTGEVSCRDRSWHDLFNAMVWLTFPRAKAALNARHVQEMAGEAPGRRGRARDALTLFDEGGLIVASADPALLQLIRDFRWKELFWKRREGVAARMRFFVFGHALYEKALAPFLGITATAVPIDVDEAFLAADLAAQLTVADARTAAVLASPEAIRTPRDLSPVPLLGIPGWSSLNADERFYDDVTYFRLGRGRRAA